MGQTQSISDPTGVGYLKTFQAIFQLAEIVIGIVVWTLIASQPYYKYNPLHFALGTIVTVWMITLFFFLVYVTGAHIKINSFFASRQASREESGETTSGALAPPSGSTVPQIRWFVGEYIMYLIMSFFLFVAVVCVTSQLHHNAHYIAACILGWLLAALYEVHFCLLFRNVESIWPFQWCYACVLKCCPDNASSSETINLVSNPTEVVTEQPSTIQPYTTPTQ